MTQTIDNSDLQRAEDIVRGVTDFGESTCSGNTINEPNDIALFLTLPANRSRVLSEMTYLSAISALYISSDYAITQRITSTSSSLFPAFMLLFFGLSHMQEPLFASNVSGFSFPGLKMHSA